MRFFAEADWPVLAESAMEGPERERAETRRSFGPKFLRGSAQLRSYGALDASLQAVINVKFLGKRNWERAAQSL